MPGLVRASLVRDADRYLAYAQRHIGAALNRATTGRVLRAQAAGDVADHLRSAFWRLQDMPPALLAVDELGTGAEARIGIEHGNAVEVGRALFAASRDVRPGAVFSAELGDELRGLATALQDARDNLRHLR